ncbi:MAG: DUF4252 domain-containing protein [Alcanivoracaceae bacterium]|nr:DUF4252 domain-containing protein [Alcanivoracaceae bacterium]
MKKLLVTLILSLSFTAINAKSFIDEVTSVVGSDPQVNINLSTSIIKTILAFSDDKDANDLNTVLKGLDKIRVSVYELDNNKNTQKLTKLIKSKVDDLSAKGYEQIVTVREKDEMVYIIAKIKDHYLEDAMIVVMEEGDELVIISMEGVVDLQQLAQISDHFDVDLNDIVGH